MSTPLVALIVTVQQYVDLYPLVITGVNNYFEILNGYCPNFNKQIPFMYKLQWFCTCALGRDMLACSFS